MPVDQCTAGINLILLLWPMAVESEQVDCAVEWMSSFDPCMCMLLQERRRICAMGLEGV